MKIALIAAVLAVGVLPQVPGSAQTPAAPKVQIKFEADGFVTLAANDATPREILAEWSRQGGSTFVNAERLPGVALTLQYTHQPENTVLASILRQASGFVLGPRRAGTVGASSIEVVYILPTSNPSASGGPMPQQAFIPQPQVSTPGSPDDELAPVQAGRGALSPDPATPQEAPRPAGVSGVAVPVVGVVPVTSPPTTGGGAGAGAGGSN